MEAQPTGLCGTPLLFTPFYTRITMLTVLMAQGGVKYGDVTGPKATGALPSLLCGAIGKKDMLLVLRIQLSRHQMVCR